MSYIKYPKNYHAHGYGWHNLAAMGYARAPVPQPAAPIGGYSASGYPGSGYPMASLSMPMPQMPPLPGSTVSAPYPAAQATGMQLSYGFASNVLPSQIPNPRNESASHAAAPQPAALPSGIGWAIGGLDNSATDGPPVHDPHQAQAEAKYESIFVPFDDRSMYSNLQFFDVSIIQ